MLILDWVMDKLGYTKKITLHWEHLLREWEEEDLKPKRRVAKKKPAVKKPASKKTVRKKV